MEAANMLAIAADNTRNWMENSTIMMIYIRLIESESGTEWGSSFRVEKVATE